MSLLWPVIVTLCAFVIWLAGLAKNEVGAILLGMAGFVAAGVLWFIYGIEHLI